jgi:DNA-binding CsgD family transcriptional regulator
MSATEGPMNETGNLDMQDVGDQLALVGDLASVLEAIGKKNYYSKLGQTVAHFMDSSRYMAIRYARYAKPEFLVNEAMSLKAVDSYLKNYYRIDPLLRMVREEKIQSVVTFDKLRRTGPDTLFYDEIYRTATIKDELVFMLPTVGGVYTAICIDRGVRVFTKAEHLRADSILPLLVQVHRLHTYQTLYGTVSNSFDDNEIATMIQDANGLILFRNAKWIGLATKEIETRVSKTSLLSPDGSEKLDGNIILHWETLDHSNAVAPAGKAVILERISLGFLDLTSQKFLEQFSVQYGLTMREKEIVGFTVEGHSTVKIAEFLKVSIGTIRNHKHRLYYKLDITTERELFSMIFNLTIGDT